MKPEELRGAYKAFFIDSPAGMHYVKQINASIAQCHENAEKQPESAAHWSQRAKGMRDTLLYVNSMIAEPQVKKKEAKAKT